jgi:transcriptional regulator with XRE-family HTH domain
MRRLPADTEPWIREQHARLGRAIAALRTERGLTAEQAAVAASLRAADLQQIEAGEAAVTAADLVQIATALNARVADLVVRASRA